MQALQPTAFLLPRRRPPPLALRTAGGVGGAEGVQGGGMFGKDGGGGFHTRRQRHKPISGASRRRLSLQITDGGAVRHFPCTHHGREWHLGQLPLHAPRGRRQSVPCPFIHSHLSDDPTQNMRRRLPLTQLVTVVKVGLPAISTTGGGHPSTACPRAY